MAALTGPRNTPAQAGTRFARSLAADAVIHAGALVCLNAAGNLVPGSESAALVADGRAYESADNTGGAAGDKLVRVDKGTYQFGNSAGADEITAAEIGDTCFVVDDQTVAKTDDTGARSAAGTIMDVDAQGVWVRFE